MAFEFRLPDLGEGITEGELVRWLVRPGDRVALDQGIAEVQTDKAVVELPSPAAGTILSLDVEEGQVIPVETLLLTIDEAVQEAKATTATTAAQIAATAAPGADGAPGIVPVTPSSEPAPSAALSGTDTNGRTSATAAAPAPTTPAAPAPTTAAAPTTPAAPAPTTAAALTTNGQTAGGMGRWTEAAVSPQRRALATPAVRRLARELGVAIATVHGNGPAGRVLAADIQAAQEPSLQEPSAQQPLPPTPLPTVGEGSKRPSPLLPAAEQPSPPPHDDWPLDPSRGSTVQRALPTAGEGSSRRHAPATREGLGAGAMPGGAEDGPAEERLPLRGLRRRIAENMVLSVSTIPQVTSLVEVDASGLVALRRAVLPAAEARGVKLSYLPFIVKALVQALRAFPYVNGSIDDATKEIVLKRHYHVGIATATPDGLLVPVLRHADRLTVLEVAAELNRLAEGGRARSLPLDELRGSTFTISNYGTVGGYFATPIINPGEAAILGLGRIGERPWAVDGRVEARPVLPLSFTADHRLIDGELAMRFLNALTATLESPNLLMLDMR